MQTLNQVPGVCSLSSLMRARADSVAHKEWSARAHDACMRGDRASKRALNTASALPAAPWLPARLPVCVGVGHHSTGEQRGVQVVSPGLTSIKSEKQQLRALAHTSRGHAPVSKLAFYLSTTVNSNWVCSIFFFFSFQSFIITAYVCVKWEAGECTLAVWKENWRLCCGIRSILKICNSWERAGEH